METNQTQAPLKAYAGTETSLDELEKEEAQRDAEQRKISVWRQIEDGKTATLVFTGKVFKREAQYENGKSLKLDFELEERTPEGKNKLFSVGSQSKVAVAIRKNLKAGNRTMLLSREGTGKATTYKVSVPE